MQENYFYVQRENAWLGERNETNGSNKMNSSTKNIDKNPGLNNDRQCD